MANETTRPDVAIFIDFENIYVSVHEKLDESPDFESIMDRCSDLGRIIIARAYADWYRYPRITSSLYANGIEPIYVPTYYYDKDMGRTGRAIKNSVDMNLCIDAMKTLFLNNNVEKFVLITGDRDFIPLVNSIRQLGKEVIIIGIGGAASSHLAQSADEFIFYEKIVGKAIPADVSVRKPKVARPAVSVPLPTIEQPVVAASPPPPPPPPTPSVSAPESEEPDIYDTLVEAVHLVRERGYISTLGSLKLVMKELMGGEFKESRYKNLNGRSFNKFKDFVLDAERRGKVQIYTKGTVSEVFLPGEDAQKLSQFSEQREGVLRPELRTPPSVAIEVGKARPSLVTPPASPSPSVSSPSSPPASLSSSSRSRRRRRPRSHPGQSKEIAPMVTARMSSEEDQGQSPSFSDEARLSGEPSLIGEVTLSEEPSLIGDMAIKEMALMHEALVDEALGDNGLIGEPENQDDEFGFSPDMGFGDGYFLPDAIQPDEELLSSFVREKEVASGQEPILPWNDDDVELLNVREQQRLSQMIESLRGERETKQDDTLSLSLIEANESGFEPEQERSSQPEALEFVPPITYNDAHDRLPFPEMTRIDETRLEETDLAMRSDASNLDTTSLDTTTLDTTTLDMSNREMTLDTTTPDEQDGNGPESEEDQEEDSPVLFTDDEWQAFRTMMLNFVKPISFGQIFDSLRGLRQQHVLVRTNEQLRSMVKQAINTGILERSGRGKRIYYVLKIQES